MIVKNYREVRAAPIVNEPGVTVRWLVSELGEDPGFALRLCEMEPGPRPLLKAITGNTRGLCSPDRE
jgi:hypothetical protein